MRYIQPSKLTELEKLLIKALVNSCMPLCSHEGCSQKRMSTDIYEQGLTQAKKYQAVNL